jgi:hypothetical protein
LPFYFIIPNVLDVTRICNDYYDFPFTILGMGEILVPAISLNYAIVHDLANVGSRIPIYFLANLIGLLMGYGGVILMLSLVYINQPPLVWVLPAMFSVNVVTSMYKKEFNEFWHGINVG